MPNWKKIITSGSDAALQSLTVSTTITASNFKTPTGTSSQYLMADGSVSTLTNPITGTGTTNYIPKFTASGAIGNSLIYDNGTNVGIGTTSPPNRLSVRGPAFSAENGSTYAASFGNVGESDFIIGSDSGNVYLQSWNSKPLIINSQGNNVLFTGGKVGIGTTSPGYKLDVNGDTNINGTLTATVKSFIIDHPTKPNKKLQYGVLEGPEHSVYVRGKLTNSRIITLPDHWHALVHEDTITVNLTPIGKKQDLWIGTVSDTTITVGSDNEINCFYTVFAERKDIEKLVTEFDK